MRTAAHRGPLGDETAPGVGYTPHARRRMQQRALADDLVRMVLQHGRAFRQPGGRCAWFVGDQDVRRAAEAGTDLSAARNVAVVVGRDGVVITVVRTSDLRRLRRPGFGGKP